MKIHLPQSTIACHIPFLRILLKFLQFGNFFIIFLLYHSKATHFPYKLNFFIRANETLDSSAHCKKKFDPSLEGRKPDFEVHIFMNQKKKNLLVLEIKSTDHA